MLKNNYEKLFYFLLLPFYFNIYILVIAFQAGSIEWGLWWMNIITDFAGAWLLSYKKNILCNIFGCMFFLLKGGYLFSALFIESMRTSHLWIYEVWFGGFIIVTGLIGIGYIMIKRIFTKRTISM